MNGQHRKQQGLTVLELLIILAAIAIVVMISVPGSTVVLEHYRLKATSADLAKSMNLAKQEATQRNSIVKVCPSSNGRFCRNDGDWNHGWLVYSDGNNDGTVQEIELIDSFQAPSQRVQIFATGAVEDRAAFTLAGLVPDHEAQIGEFHVCNRGLDSRAKVVSIDSDGWVQVSRTESGSGVCSRS